MRRFLRSRERRRSSNYSDDQMIQFRRSSSPGVPQIGINNLGTPVQDFRRGSLNSLTVPNCEERRSSYPGTVSAHMCGSLERRKSSTAAHFSKDSIRFNPNAEKLSNKCVIKVIGGMILLLILVLIISVYKLVT